MIQFKVSKFRLMKQRFVNAVFGARIYVLTTIRRMRILLTAKQWIVSRLKFLSYLYTIDICA